MQFIALRRFQRSQFFTTRREVLQRVVLDGRRKLVSHLCRHKGDGDVLALEILIQGDKVQTNLFWDDIQRGTTCKCRIRVIHISIETIAGIGRNLVCLLQVVVAMIPVDESHQITMHQLTALGHSC